MLIPFIVLLLFSFSGCKKASAVEPKFNNLSFTVDALWDDVHYIFDGSVKENRLYLTAISPETQRNIKIAIKEQELTFNYLDLEKILSANQLPKNSVLSVLLSCFTEKNNVYCENDRYYIKLKDDRKDYIFYITQSGLPLKICEEKGNNQILFKGITIQNLN